MAANPKPNDLTSEAQPEFTFWAHIKDPHGLADGRTGFVWQVVAARDETHLRHLVGDDLMPYMVPAPNAQCAMWHYKDGVFTNPEEAPAP